MSDRPFPPDDGRRPDRKGGPVIGFVLTLLLAGAGFFLGRDVGGLLVTPIVFVAGGWLILRRHIPGYGRGAAWGVAVIVVVFTACVAILVAAFS